MQYTIYKYIEISSEREKRKGKKNIIHSYINLYDVSYNKLRERKRETMNLQEHNF